jgi:hypothetical protein
MVEGRPERLELWHHRMEAVAVLLRPHEARESSTPGQVILSEEENAPHLGSMGQQFVLGAAGVTREFTQERGVPRGIGRGELRV